MALYPLCHKLSSAALALPCVSWFIRWDNCSDPTQYPVTLMASPFAVFAVLSIKLAALSEIHI
jgi:hypothetical protein